MTGMQPIRLKKVMIEEKKAFSVIAEKKAGEL